MKETYTTSLGATLTIENLKKAATYIKKMEEKPLPKGLGWFTKIMNRFGWHRNYEIIFFDKRQFEINYNAYDPRRREGV